jgi:hypothetical protein
MKTFLLLSFILSVPNLFSQQQVNVAALKKENEILKNQIQSLKNDTTLLREKLSTCDLYNKPKDFSVEVCGKLKFEFLSCKYNLKEKTVRIEFIVINPLSSGRFWSGTAEAFDELGNKYNSLAYKIKGDSNFDLISDIPVKCFIEFKDILPGVDYFKIVKLQYWGIGNAEDCPTSDNRFVEIKNFKIEK